MHMTVQLLDLPPNYKKVKVDKIKQVGQGGRKFDVVKIEDWNGVLGTSVSFLVPEGKGEGLAAALREVLGL